MADASIPFKGEFGFDDEAAGAENNELSNQLINLTFTPDRVKIGRGPYLGTNHREDIVGSSAVTVNFTVGEMTHAQILQFYTDWEAGTLMEYMYLAEAGTLGTGTATNLHLTAQLYMVNPPTLPGVMDEEYTWSPGEILATYGQITDGSSPVAIGTAA